jgi:hypothetical protein
MDSFALTAHFVKTAMCATYHPTGWQASQNDVCGNWPTKFYDRRRKEIVLDGIERI